MTTWLGIDPGGRETGIAVRRGDRLLAWAVTVRRGQDTTPPADYVAAVAIDALAALADAGVAADDPALRVASEDVRYWPGRSGHHCPACRGTHVPARNMTGVLGAAIVHGAILARWPATVIVPPGQGHGGLHGLAYPEPIRPSGRGHDRARHARSAWDVTYHAETLAHRAARADPT